MTRTTFILIGVLYYIFTVAIIIIVLNLLEKKEKKKYKDAIETLCKQNLKMYDEIFAN